MTEQTTHFGTNYRSLNDIRLRKAQLRTDLTKDSNKIAGLWNERFSGAFNVGANVLDGLILTWKLYRMFGGKQSSGPFNKFSLFKKKKK